MLVKGNAFFKLLEFYDSYRKNFYKKTWNLSVNVQITSDFIHEIYNDSNKNQD